LKLISCFAIVLVNVNNFLHRLVVSFLNFFERLNCNVFLNGGFHDWKKKLNELSILILVLIKKLIFKKVVPFKYETSI